MAHPAPGHPGTDEWGDEVDASLAALPAAYAPGVSVMAYGAVRDGTTLDTVAINAAITANPGKVISLPNNAAGTAIYLVDAGGATIPTMGIVLNQPGTKLVLDPGVTIKVQTNALDRYAAISITAADCSVTGGTILGDVDTHTGTTGESGHGIQVGPSAHRATVNYTRITKCWGDGIILGESVGIGTGTPTPTDCLLQNVICDDNRRQGLSIIAVIRLQIIGGSYINTGLTAFTSPGAGIDIEPNGDCLQDVIDIVIIGAVLQGNHGSGFMANGGPRIISGTVTGVRALDNGGDGFMTANNADLIFNGCFADRNALNGFNQAETSSGTPSITFNSCKATANTTTPICSGFLIRSGGTANGCHAINNNGPGFTLSGTATAVACTAKGNNIDGVYYWGQFVSDVGTAVQMIACVSDVGGNAVKPHTGFGVMDSSANTNLIGCRTVGTFPNGPLVDGGTNTNALPNPGAAKQTGTPAAATDAATTQALVNDLRTKLLALGHIN